MPIPIGLVTRNTLQPNFSGYGLLDISFLATHMPKEAGNISTTVADKDADALMKIWLHAKKSDKDKYDVVDIDLDNKEILRLKSRGFISGSSKEIKFTSKGKTIISTMSLGESNSFLKSKKNKSYTEILASMNKKGKKGYRIAGVFDENSHLIGM
jgi:hypothetical protein